MKNCLKKVVGNATLTMDELSMVFVEVEAVLNSRPLTYVAAEEIEEPLTLAHLLTGRCLIELPDAETVLEMNADPDFLVPSDCPSIIIKGSDEQIRAAVRLASRSGITTLKRPVQLLYPLKINHADHEESESEPQGRGAEQQDMLRVTQKRCSGRGQAEDQGTVAVSQ